MIKVNNIVIEANQFPDHTLLVKAPTLRGHGKLCDIEWKYEDDSELFTLICLRKHYSQAKARLWMFYCPHARMDRVKDISDVFTLKYFAEVINDLNFIQVNILDPHSSVCTALINNVRVLSPKDYIVKVIEECKPDLLFFPDEGASKRYADMFPTYKYIYGNKKREWETGKIICTEIINPFDVDLQNKTILIIDDICSRGTTFVKSAEALQLYNVGNIYLWITHCENTILDGEIFTSGLINKVYTTNSLFTKTHESIKVIKFGNLEI